MLEKILDLSEVGKCYLLKDAVVKAASSLRANLVSGAWKIKCGDRIFELIYDNLTSSNPGYMGHMLVVHRCTFHTLMEYWQVEYDSSLKEYEVIATLHDFTLTLKRNANSSQNFFELCL